MIYQVLPYFIFKRLFGDREKYGLKADLNDPDFVVWEKMYTEFYLNTQKKGVGYYVNHFSFKIMRHVDLTGKVVLELGPGLLEHLQYNQTKPKQYIIADVFENFLDGSENILKKKYGISDVQKLKVNRTKIPVPDNSVDMLISFHQLEHVYDLGNYLLELKRILKPGGLLVGAVPTEGSLAWGAGRYLTARRFVSKNMASLNYNKIICWEHPNFVNKIYKSLEQEFVRVKNVRKPFNFLPFDFNLSFSFIYTTK